LYFRTKVCSLIYLCIYHILYTHVYACVVLYTLTRNVDVYKSETRLSFKKPWIVFFFTAFKKFQACLALQWAKNYSKEGKGVLHYCICGCVYVCVCICMYMSHVRRIEMQGRGTRVLLFFNFAVLALTLRVLWKQERTKERHIVPCPPPFQNLGLLFIHIIHYCIIILHLLSLFSSKMKFDEKCFFFFFNQMTFSNNMSRE